MSKLSLEDIAKQCPKTFTNMTDDEVQNWCLDAAHENRKSTVYKFGYDSYDFAHLDIAPRVQV